ncbi:hypothetical protein QEG73_21445 [Chitinophagaceae bacterium 26-R-25]|nr:hypothetical protein [Chitinophagaceae bacterium 26-R-25]
MANRFYIVVLFSFSILMGCSNDGLFGHSKTKEEAKANGSMVIEYVPDKGDFILLDGTKMQIDTAWTEMSFTYKEGKRIIDTTYGYHFSIPVRNDSLEKFTFTFGLLDTANRVFTNPGPGKEGLTQLCPRYLYDKMEVVLEQKNPDTSFGWLKPIITDTIIFKKLK